MRAEIWLKNYRAFDEASNARFEMHDGFIAFVGVNNSGKSSLLRFFHEARPTFQLLDMLHDANVQAALTTGSSYIGFLSVADNEEIFCNRNERPAVAEVRITEGDEPAPPHEPSLVRFVWTRPGPMVSIELEYNGARAQVLSVEPDHQVTVRCGGIDTPLDLSRYQRLMQELASSIYLGPFRNAVNVGGTNYYDLDIGQKFITKWDTLKRGNLREQNRTAIAIENELAGIFGLESIQINAAPGDTTMQVIADGQPYQLQEQGAGFAQFIVVLAYVATSRPAWILIDEPELNLHPSLQLDFLTTLAKYSQRGVAFATHSIGLARAVGQSIYSVRRIGHGGRQVRPLEATPDIVEFLGEVSLSGYQELGFTGILLVEGTTEIPVVQQWLRFYGAEHTTVLLPLGGSSMINATSAMALGEIQRITTNVSVLIDSERASEGAPLETHRQAFVDACEQLGFNVHVTTLRATENYFTDEAIKAVKGTSYVALGGYEKLSDAEQAWGKNENWKIAGRMVQADLDSTDIGQFLATISGPRSTGPAIVG